MEQLTHFEFNSRVNILRFSLIMLLM